MKPDFEAIKASTDIVAVVQSYGVQLKKVGRNHVGLCPFHADANPSLVVTQSNGLFRCPACGATGNVIQFVARKENISDKAAALKLLDTVPGVARGAGSTPPPVQSPPPNASALLKRVVSFYAKALHKDKAGLEYLRSRNLCDAVMLETFQVGYCNGSLHEALPKSGEVIEGLKALGVLNEKGNERFYGRVVVPIFDGAGEVCGLYGRRLNDEQPRHLYLAGAHRGVWNGAAFKVHQSVMLTESIFDAMSLWQAGFKNAVALYGKEGWTSDHATLLQQSGVREIFLCLDNDEAGREATARLKKEVLPAVVPSLTVHALQWPDGIKDANDFFLSRSAVDFETLLKAANPQTQQVSEQSAKLGNERIEMMPDGFMASYGPNGVRRYELRAIERPSAARLKATVKALGSEPGRFHIDTVDFYLSRSRRAFMSEAARLFREEVETVEADVNRIIIQLEAYAAQSLEASTPVVSLVSEAERAEALKLGRHPDLVGEVLRDFEKLGMVGEEVNKLAGYLVMTSRKMADPLALLIISGSGAGKSHLQDTILSLCPEEDLIKLTSLSGQALFYKGEDSLRHKVLALEEEAGANNASYAIRNLISAKKLTIETTIKNALTGKLETQVNMVHGPTAVFVTTTNPQTDAETRSRFIVTSVDESSEQTRVILEAQRHGHTLEGMLKKERRGHIALRHHALQRLLRPLKVVNPFEPLLAYAEDRLVMRRENPKYLHLILCVTFLYQMQRPIKEHAELGEYIETTLDDIAVANEIAGGLFGHSLDELSRPSRELLKLIRDFVEQRAAGEKCPREQVGFTRREVREYSGWSDYQIKAHIKQLEELEYLAAGSGRRGQLFAYRLAWDGSGERFLPGLVSVEEVRERAQAVGLVGEVGGEVGGLKTKLEGSKENLEGGSRAQVGLGENATKPYVAGTYGQNGAKLEGLSESLVRTLHGEAKNNGCVSVANGGFDGMA